LSLVVSIVALVVAVVAVVAGLGVGLSETEVGTKVIGANGAVNLGVASILCSLVAIPIGFVGWRWAERRGQEPTLGKSATLIGVGTFATWFVLFVYALGKDTP
jgi:predicted amino acid dehydrogenase